MWDPTLSWLSGVWMSPLNVTLSCGKWVMWDTTLLMTQWLVNESCGTWLFHVGNESCVTRLFWWLGDMWMSHVGHDSFDDSVMCEWVMWDMTLSFAKRVMCDMTLSCVLFDVGDVTRACVCWWLMSHDSSVMWDVTRSWVLSFTYHWVIKEFCHCNTLQHNMPTHKRVVSHMIHSYSTSCRTPLFHVCAVQHNAT